MNNAIFLLYTDPGTGALLWQLLAAGFIGGAFYFRQYAAKIKVYLTQSRTKRS